MTNYTPDAAQWKFRNPPHRSGASGQIKTGRLTVSLNAPDHYNIGIWESEFTLAPGWYDYSVTVHTDATMTDLYVLNNIYTPDARTTVRDHAEREEKTEGGWRFTDRIFVPEDATKIKLELWLKGYTGTAAWELPVITAAEEPAPRKVRVAIGYIKPHSGTLEDHREDFLRILDKCVPLHPDVILFSECMYERGVAMPPLEKAESVADGAMIALMRQKCAELGSYMVYNFHEIDGGEYYNSSLLIDRAGAIVGKYHKTHLTVAELEEGMTPGHDHPVFDTDFGRVGLLTCFDQYFPEPANELAKKGAEIVFIPTAGDAREKCHARALDGGMYVCVGGMNTENPYGWEASRIIAPDGEILCQTKADGDVILAEIDLSKKVRRHWLSTGGNMTEIKAVYRYEKNVHSY